MQALLVWPKANTAKGAMEKGLLRLTREDGRPDVSGSDTTGQNERALLEHNGSRAVRSLRRSRYVFRCSVLYGGPPDCSR